MACIRENYYEMILFYSWFLLQLTVSVLSLCGACERGEGNDFYAQQPLPVHRLLSELGLLYLALEWPKLSCDKMLRACARASWSVLAIAAG